MTSLKGKTADQIWLKANKILEARRGCALAPSRAGNTAELLHVSAELEDPRQRWVVSRCPPMNVAFAIVEVIGILNGRQDSDYLNFFNRSLPRFAGTGPTYYGAYGHRLRSSFDVDQIERAYQILSSNRVSRQVVMQFWDPRLDLPDTEGRPRSEDIPCNISSLLKVRDGKLFWTQVMRSNDLFRGLPYNMVQFTTLQEVIAGWLGLNLGSYFHVVDSLHLYETDFAASTPPKVRYIKNSDSLALAKPAAEGLWQLMNERLNLLISREVDDSAMRELASLPHTGLQNLMTIVVAEVARRRKRRSLAVEIAESCKNPGLAAMWFRWLSARPENSIRNELRLVSKS